MKLASVSLLFSLVKLASVSLLFSLVKLYTRLLLVSLVKKVKPVKQDRLVFLYTQFSQVEFACRGDPRVALEPGQGSGSAACRPPAPHARCVSPRLKETKPRCGGDGRRSLGPWRTVLPSAAGQRPARRRSLAYAANQIGDSPGGNQYSSRSASYRSCSSIRLVRNRSRYACQAARSNR